MQPHHPFMGETRIENNHGFVRAIAKSTGNKVSDVRFVWERLRADDLDKETIWEAYEDNLKFVLGSIHPFVKWINNKTIIILDYRSDFNVRVDPFPTHVRHRDSLRIPALISASWFAPVYDSRRNAVNDLMDQTAVEVSIEARLKALGCKSD